MAHLGYGRVSTDGQSLAAQVAELKAAGCTEIFQEKISGAKSDRKQLARLIARLGAGDVLVVTRLDRLARSTRDLLNMLGALADKGAGFQITAGYLGRHDHAARPADADGPGRPRRVRARIDQKSHRRRQGARQSSRG